MEERLKRMKSFLTMHNNENEFKIFLNWIDTGRGLIYANDFNKIDKEMSDIIDNAATESENEENTPKDKTSDEIRKILEKNIDTLEKIHAAYFEYKYTPKIFGLKTDGPQKTICKKTPLSALKRGKSFMHKGQH